MGNMNTMVCNYSNDEMPLGYIKNLYVPIGIPFDPKLFYKDEGYTRLGELMGKGKEESGDGGWSTYVPNDEWKSMERERNDPKHGSQENAPSFMNDTDERLKEKKFKLIETPRERISSPDQEFDNWAKTNGFVNTSDDESVELVTK
ncbi:hypothetical protein Tco_1338450 [Tanacetum coccineum]